ncbi:hypothetical protein [Streptomyces sp. NPDC048527]|uniref:hypothetical protein n=1 Tax=Streptomyces sp. NPDC048527 TaxID=3365568 RepID=UPI00371425CA
MRNLILQLAFWALVLCTPLPRGRHRSRGVYPAPVPALRPPVTPQLRCAIAPLDGDASPLVRPYLLGDAEAFLERRRQRERRRVLYLATFGVDLGARRIHGVRVPVAVAVAR